MIPKYEPQPDPGEPLCNDPTHDPDCDCGADPDRVFEEGIGA